MAARATLQSLARELGCSAKTVSNAFSRPDQLSPQLRRRVLATAAARGYPGPDPLAAGLRRGRVGALGFAYANPLSYAFEDPVSVRLLAGISGVVEASGSGLLLVPGSASPERNAAAIAAAVIDGLIIGSLADDDPLIGAAARRGLPTVVVDQPYPDRVSAAWVGVDDRGGARAAARHLLELGHRELGVVCFGLTRGPVRGLVDPAAPVTYAVSRERLGGYRDAVGDGTSMAVWAGTGSTVADGCVGARLLLARVPRPTGLLCMSDRLAQGALQAAAQLGLRVPQELSIVGFDDAGPAAELRLTTVRQPVRRKGALAATALLELLAGGQTPAPRRLPVQLVVRSSTGPARG